MMTRGLWIALLLFALPADPAWAATAVDVGTGGATTAGATGQLTADAVVARDRNLDPTPSANLISVRPNGTTLVTAPTCANAQAWSGLTNGLGIIDLDQAAKQSWGLCDIATQTGVAKFVSSVDVADVAALVLGGANGVGIGTWNSTSNFVGGINVTVGSIAVPIASGKLGIPTVYEANLTSAQASTDLVAGEHGHAFGATVVSSGGAWLNGLDLVETVETVDAPARLLNINLHNTIGTASSKYGLNIGSDGSQAGTAGIMFADTNWTTGADFNGNGIIRMPSLIGSASSGGTLTLSSTSHATKGKILFGTSGYDEVNNRLGVGTASPGFSLEVDGAAELNATDANLVLQGATKQWLVQTVDSAGTAGRFRIYDATDAIEALTILATGAVTMGATTLGNTYVNGTLGVGIAAPSSGVAEVFRDYSVDGSTARTVGVLTRAYSGGAGSAGIGGSLLLRAESGTDGTMNNIALMQWDTTGGSVTAGAGTGNLQFQVANAGTLTQVLSLSVATGILMPTLKSTSGTCAICIDSNGQLIKTCGTPAACTGT